MANATVFCLMGPTAVGKTDLACSIVQHFPCEIISVDSVMIYRYLNIGAAKPDAHTLAEAPHHLIDICNPNESYSVAAFCDDAVNLCRAICKRGKIPLLVGGTMMYFRALQQGLAKLPAADENIRAQLLQQAHTHGWDHLHQQLTAVDPVSAQKIHPHDTQRLQRALEVYLLTAQPLSVLMRNANESPEFEYVNVLLMPKSRRWLHERIEQRFEQMLMEGLVAEVEYLIAQWSLTATHASMRSVGYRQVFEYLQGAYDDDTLLAKGVAATRQLAKRQLTWLRHWPNGSMFEADDPACIKEVLAQMQQILDN